MADPMPKERDPDSGQFTEAVADQALVEFLAERDGASTSEVADHFGYERPSAYRRLKRLREAGDVASREIGNSLLWTATGDS